MSHNLGRVTSIIVEIFLPFAPTKQRMDSNQLAIQNQSSYMKRLHFKILDVSLLANLINLCIIKLRPSVIRNLLVEIREPFFRPELHNIQVNLQQVTKNCFHSKPSSLNVKSYGQVWTIKLVGLFLRATWMRLDASNKPTESI